MGDPEVRATFNCAICAQFAGDVEFIRQGVPRQAAGGTALELLDQLTAAAGAVGGARVIVRSFLGTASLPVHQDHLDATEAAVRAGDAPALYAIAYSRAPFCCPQCGAVYCGNHWRRRHFSDERLGFEGVEGWCPMGHFHVLEY